MAEQTEKRGDTMTVREAREALGVSPTKMAKMIKDGVLHATQDPVDTRFKLIPRAEVEALKARSRKSATSD